MKQRAQEKTLLLATTIFLVLAFIIMIANTITLQSLTSSKISTQTTSETIDTLSSPPDAVIPSGVPDVYGETLSIAYDDVNPRDPLLADQTIGVMSDLDRSITLNEQERERYINILYNMHGGISCEYCCGAKAVIFSNGEPACGCAHSYAMRGLTKYLLTQYGDSYSDEDILREVAKWKILYFPTQHEAKASILAEEGIPVDELTLTTNQYRGIEQGIQGGMVGGC